MSQNEDVTTEKMQVFDFSEITRTKHVQVNHIIYRIRSLGSAEYLKIVEQQQKLQALKQAGATKKSIDSMNKILDDIIIPLFEVDTDVKQEDGVELLPFTTLIKRLKAGSGFAYRMLMDRMAMVIMPNPDMGEREL